MGYYGENMLIVGFERCQKRNGFVDITDNNRPSVRRFANPVDKRLLFRPQLIPPNLNFNRNEVTARAIAQNVWRANRNASDVTIANLK